MNIMEYRTKRYQLNKISWGKWQVVDWGVKLTNPVVVFTGRKTAATIYHESLLYPHANTPMKYDSSRLVAPDFYDWRTHNNETPTPAA